MRGIEKDQIARLPLARLSVGDIERWHTRLRRAGMHDAGVKNQHGVLRAALSQAVRWAWASTNVASMARLRSTKTQGRTVMTLDEVRSVMAAAESIDPAAALMLRIAAVSGARRAELAALQWTDMHDGMLTVDSAIEFASSGDGTREFRDAATKTANTRTLTLDADTVAAIETLRNEREPYGPWMLGLGLNSFAVGRDAEICALIGSCGSRSLSGGRHRHVGRREVTHLREVVSARSPPSAGG